MKSQMPRWWEKIYWHSPKNSDDLFIDVEHLEVFKTPEGCFHKHFDASRFGKDIFVFDIKSCEFIIQTEGFEFLIEEEK